MTAFSATPEETQDWLRSVAECLVDRRLDQAAPEAHPSAMVWPFEAPGQWIADGRGEGRGVRVSAHEEAGFLILSTWKANVCVGTVRLLPDEAADLVAGVAEALGRLASRPPTDDGSADLELRLAAMEERVRRLEA